MQANNVLCLWSDEKTFSITLCLKENYWRITWHSSCCLVVCFFFFSNFKQFNTLQLLLFKSNKKGDEYFWKEYSWGEPHCNVCDSIAKQLWLHCCLHRYLMCKSPSYWRGKPGSKPHAKLWSPDFQQPSRNSTAMVLFGIGTMQGWDCSGFFWPSSRSIAIPGQQEIMREMTGWFISIYVNW